MPADISPNASKFFSVLFFSEIFLKILAVDRFFIQSAAGIFERKSSKVATLDRECDGFGIVESTKASGWRRLLGGNFQQLLRVQLRQARKVSSGSFIFRKGD